MIRSAFTLLSFVISTQFVLGQTTDYFKNYHPKGSMNAAANQYCENRGQQDISGLPGNAVTIVVKNETKASNVVSFYEGFLRNDYSWLDTSVYYITQKDWKHLSPQEKVDVINKQKVRNTLIADSIHKVNNTGRQLICMVNNTDKDIALQMQDASVIEVLEAYDISNREWKPVEYWQYSKCGNSYMLKHIAPKTSAWFIVPLHNTGDYNTMLRYKILGKEKFYYSLPFKGTISSTDLYDSSSYKTEKLETFVKRYYGE